MLETEGSLPTIYSQTLLRELDETESELELGLGAGPELEPELEPESEKPAPGHQSKSKEHLKHLKRVSSLELNLSLIGMDSGDLDLMVRGSTFGGL